MAIMTLSIPADEIEEMNASDCQSLLVRIQSFPSYLGKEQKISGNCIEKVNGSSIRIVFLIVSVFVFSNFRVFELSWFRD